MDEAHGLLQAHSALMPEGKAALFLLGDEELAFKAGAGNEAAFQVLASRWWKRLGRLAATAVGYDPLLAEEVAQDSLIRLHSALPRFRGESSFSTFLWRICHRAAQDAQRRILRERRRFQPLPEAPFDLADPASSPEDEALEREELDRLTRLVAALPVEERLLVHLHEVEGLDLAQLSRIFGRPQGTLKSRLHRIRAKLALRLKEYGP